MKSKYVSAKNSDVEQVLKMLKDTKLLNYGLKFKKKEGFVKIPVLESDSDYEDFELSVRDNNYKHHLNIPEELYKLLPTSFDVIGDIAIIKIPDSLSNYKKDIAEAICTVNKHIKKVAEDRGVKGEFRVRDLTILKGQNLVTVHRENSIKIKVDLDKIYFSPRLANERSIIASQIQDNETILDMFCGVGPFSLAIAKSKNARIYAVDKNPFAIEYLKENIILNKVSNIVPILGDAKDICTGIDNVDRVIMNNPHHSLDFLDQALKIAKHWIYLYIITDDNARILEILSSKIQKFKCNIRLVHDYSPSEALYCFEISLNSL
jgi:tRNA (guanine37-N1)-methyltransferase